MHSFLDQEEDWITRRPSREGVVNRRTAVRMRTRQNISAGKITAAEPIDNICQNNITGCSSMTLF